MKSILIWLASTGMCALVGYGLSFLLTNINVFILVAGGLVIGSSLGITINIHRERRRIESEIEVNDSSDY